MITENFPFTDFNGTQRTVELHFNLTKIEISELMLASEKGLEVEIRDFIDNNDTAGLLHFVKKLIVAGYGIKSSDGLHFRKSPQIVDDFVSSAVYSDFLMSLFVNGAEKGLAFIQGMLPPDLIDAAANDLQKNGIPTIKTQNAPAQPQDYQRPAEPSPFHVSPNTGFVTGSPDTRREQREGGYREPVRENGPDYEQTMPVQQSPHQASEGMATDLHGRPPFESGPGFQQN